MVDAEVEDILSEIRERVRAQELTRAVADPSQSNGAGETHISLEASRETSAALAAEAVGLIDSYLTVTSRAWDRLPPVASNRSGSIAQIELWVKRVFKRATHWFTWEQINFNAAAHHALQEVNHALSAYAQALEGLRAEAEGRRAMLEQIQLGLKSEREELETQRGELRAQRGELQAQRGELQAQRAELATQRAAHLAQREEIDARFSEAAQVMQKRLDHLREEQRVCFKQLSLETTEAAVLEDRARRKTETLLEEFRERVAQLEK